MERLALPSQVHQPNGQGPDLESQRRTVALARAGDTDAMGQLYDNHVGQVFRYSLARLGNYSDAEDITSEVFMKALSGLPNYERRQDIPFAVWLMRITRNHVVSFTRSNRHKFQETELPEEIVDRKATDPAVNVEKRAQLEEMRRAIYKLPEAQREVIILRFFSDLSVADVARILGKQENNIKVLTTKAITRLRDLMDVQPEKSRGSQKDRLSSALMTGNKFTREELASVARTPMSSVTTTLSMLRKDGLDIKCEDGFYFLAETPQNMDS